MKPSKLDKNETSRDHLNIIFHNLWKLKISRVLRNWVLRLFKNDSSVNNQCKFFRISGPPYGSLTKITLIYGNPPECEEAQES